jgi:hypothetical protein
VVFGLATAALLDCAVGPYQGKETGELALFRSLLGNIHAGDVLLADRYFCSYFMVALALQRGAQVVFRMHQARDVDFRRGQRWGPGDHEVVWRKPARPEWMDEATYAQMPDQLVVRECRMQVHEPGYRVEELTVVTTLLDAAAYPKEDIMDLYHERWHVELDIRSLKVTLEIDVLRCQTPEMIRRELWAHLLAYNLVRKVIAQAAWEAGVSPRTISFTGAVQQLCASWDRLTTAGPGEVARQGRMLLVAVATHRVGNRPGRCEPRAKKRRPKAMPLLKKPRRVARAELLAGGAKLL